MGFTIYEKERQSRSLAPRLSISAKLGRCTLNRAAAESLDKDGVTAVLLAWDADTHRIAIKHGTNKDPRSFALQVARDKKTKKVTSAAFSGVLFLKHIGYDLSDTKGYTLTWVSEHSHFEAQLPVERFQAKQQTLVAVEGGKKHEKAAG